MAGPEPKIPLVRDLQKELDRFTYKKNVTLRVHFDMHCEIISRALSLEITIVTDDATGRSKDLIPVITSKAIPPDLFDPYDVREFQRFVYNCIEAVERHEIREWLKFDGRHVLHPHPELR